jgi:hypothetical protein
MAAIASLTGTFTKPSFSLRAQLEGRRARIRQAEALVRGPGKLVCEENWWAVMGKTVRIGTGNGWTVGTVRRKQLSELWATEKFGDLDFMVLQLL